MYRMDQKNMNTMPSSPKKYWFVAKTYGWGWTPATWQGWTILAIFVVLIVLNFLRIDAASDSINNTLLAFVPETIALIAVLVLICWKTGEKPRWNAGMPPKK